ncbi:MAG: phosphate ABC transporter substrate-binding protein PstS [Actinomycetota bacterium]|nr:phosphate ABC transporter substrate-binding protein PstS [Actinomycetota bacterium]
MVQRKILVLATSGIVALGVTACGSSDNGSSGGTSTSSQKLGGTINGAGATFPAPVYQEWGNRFKQRFGTTVNYQAIGSGGGIAQFTQKTVEFGASDAAMTDDEIKAAAKNGAAVHIPTVLGAVTVSYDLDGVDKGLKLDGATVADLFLGKIKHWNDPAIAKLNSGVKLASEKVTVCHRSDESGTTKNFTQFLAHYSPAWKKGPGVDKTVKWPTGTGAKGNDGVAGCVKQTKGAVGYVEQAYALQNNFTTADVKNAAGKFVAPTLDSTSAAGVGAKPPPDLRFSTINAAGAQAYPISAVTFLLVYRDLCQGGMSQTQAKAVKTWLDYATGDGQQVATQLQYAPLPASVLSKAKAKVTGLQCNGRPVQGAA